MCKKILIQSSFLFIILFSRARQTLYLFSMILLILHRFERIFRFENFKHEDTLPDHSPLNNFFIFTNAQVVINQSFSPTQLVNKFLRPGIQVSNINYNGTADAIGYFIGTSSNLGLDSGIVLSTGYVTDIPGPNLWDDISGELFTNGDFDLDQLSGFTTYDATILEFDFVPSSNTVEFKFVFGSDEYDEWVCTEYKDVFGFFVSGPGITGQQNIALLPGTTLPISINTVNNGTPGFNASGAPCNLNNSSYFVSNPPFVANSTVELDGFTVVITVTMQVPFPCQTYHIKLAIADAEDEIYDSAIFLQARSFTSAPEASIYAVTNVIDTAVVEVCRDGTFFIEIPEPLQNDTTIYITIGETAINGIDYIFIPDSVIIPAGSTIQSFTIIVKYSDVCFKT